MLCIMLQSPQSLKAVLRHQMQNTAVPLNKSFKIIFGLGKQHARLGCMLASLICECTAPETTRWLSPYLPNCYKRP